MVQTTLIDIIFPLEMTHIKSLATALFITAIVCMSAGMVLTSMAGGISLYAPPTPTTHTQGVLSISSTTEIPV